MVLYKSHMVDSVVSWISWTGRCGYLILILISILHDGVFSMLRIFELEVSIGSELGVCF
jgi:hypothetical protein